jgi:hypothetical protein
MAGETVGGFLGAPRGDQEGSQQTNKKNRKAVAISGSIRETRSIRERFLRVGPHNLPSSLLPARPGSDRCGASGILRARRTPARMALKIRESVVARSCAAGYFCRARM